MGRRVHSSSTTIMPRRLVAVAGALSRLLLGGAENLRMLRARKAGFASLAARSTALLPLLFLLPMALEQLGPERYGLWLLLTSLATVFGFADLGIGNSILNAVAAARAKDDRNGINAAASSGGILLVAVAAIFLAAALVAYALVDWPDVFNVHTARAKLEARHGLLAFAVCFAINLPLSLPTKVQHGMQDGYFANVLLAACNLLAFGAVYVALRLGCGIPILILLHFGLPAMLNAGAGVFYFHRHAITLQLVRSWRTVQASGVAGAGLYFLLMQLLTIANSRVDAFFVTRYGDAAEAGIFMSCDRLFAVVSMVPYAFLFPLWISYRDALGRGDVDWVRQTFARSLRASCLFAAALCLPILVFGRAMFALWLGAEADVPAILLLGFAVWKIVECAAAAGSMLLNGAGWLRHATMMLGSMAALSMVAKLLLVPVLGTHSVIWITAACCAACSVLPLPFIVPAILRSGQLQGLAE